MWGDKLIWAQDFGGGTISYLFNNFSQYLAESLIKVIRDVLIKWIIKWVYDYDIIGDNITHLLMQRRNGLKVSKFYMH